MKDLKGFGYPDFQLTPHGYLKREFNERVIRGNLLSLLLTNHKERIMMPDFGGDLEKFLFAQNTPDLHRQIRDRIIETIELWEKRIVVWDITVDKGEEEHIVRVSIQYSLKEDLDNSHNLVFNLESR